VGAPLAIIEPISLSTSTGLGALGGTTAGGGTLGGVGAGGGYGGAAAGGYGGAVGGIQGGGLSVLETFLNVFLPEVEEPRGLGMEPEVVSSYMYNPVTNQLMVYNTPSNLAKFEATLSEFDVMPKQVSIEARFVTIKLADLDKKGFKWDLTLSDQNARAREIESLSDTATYLYDINGDGVEEEIPFYRRPDGSSVISNTITEGILQSVVSPGPPGDFSLSGIITGKEDGDKLSVVFDYLNSLDQVELLSAPRVTTMNRKPAVIVDYTSEYFISQVYDETYVIPGGGAYGGTPVTVSRHQVQPQQFNFGISLSVTPQISGGDQVRLWLNPQVTTRGIEKKFSQLSRIGEEVTETEYVLPNTSTQSVWTNVIVHDGDTLVLGGLVADETTKGERKMPYLADIPLLGAFFRGKHRQVKQSSLLIFVTPDIIDTTGARFFEVGM